MAWPTAPIHGKIARIAIGTTASGAAATTMIDYTSRWVLNYSKDAVVYGIQGAEYKYAVPGQRSMAGSGEFVFVCSSDQSTLIGMAVTSAAAAITTTVDSTKLKFFFDSTQNFLHSTGVIITGLTFDAPVGDLIRCTFTFQCHGHMTIQQMA